MKIGCRRFWLEASIRVPPYEVRGYGGRESCGWKSLPRKAYKVLPSRQTNPGTMGQRIGAFVEDLFFKLSVVMIVA